jgi:hypothetical protein
MWRAKVVGNHLAFHAGGPASHHYAAEHDLVQMEALLIEDSAVSVDSIASDLSRGWDGRTGSSAER